MMEAELQPPECRHEGSNANPQPSNTETAAGESNKGTQQDDIAKLHTRSHCDSIEQEKRAIYSYQDNTRQEGEHAKSQADTAEGEKRVQGLGVDIGDGEKPLDKLIKGDTEDATSRWKRMEGECSDSSDTTGDEEEVDPRIAENLEIMNQSCGDVNKLENELDEARSKYRSTFQVSSQRMEELGSKIKRSIQRARPYYELTEKAKEAQNEAIRAARQYQTANGNYRAAKEMITLAEQGFVDGESSTRSLSTAWQETLNHATVKVMESEREKTRSEAEHNKRAAIYVQLEARLHHLEKKYKRSITRARPYFETKAELELKLQQLKQNVWDLQQAISTRKARYAEALRRLEALSAEIHESRRSRQKLMLQFPREPGVGAESDSLGSSISDSNIERGVFSSSVSFEEDDDDESDDSCDVFSAGSLEHSSHEKGRSKTSCRRQTEDRRSDSSASGSVFSSEGACDSLPQSPSACPEVSSVSAQAVRFSVGDSPAPRSSRASTTTQAAGPPDPVRAGTGLVTNECASDQPLQTAAIPGEVGHPGNKTGAGDARPRTVTAAGGDGATERGTGDVPKTKSLDLQDQRVAGDGSAHDDSPREEIVSTPRTPRTPRPADDHLCVAGSGSSPHSQGTDVAHEGGTPNSRACSGSPCPRSEGGDNWVSMAASESKLHSQSDSEVSSKLVGGQVTKEPLRRTDAKHKSLQGVMLLNPSELAASSSFWPF